MVEQVCDTCQHGNPLENRFCGHCGANLNRPKSQLGQWRQTAVSITDRPLPTPQLKQLGQTVAVSLLALAAEASLSWLNRRLKEESNRKPQAIKMRSPEPVEEVTQYTVTTVTQKFVEIRRNPTSPKGKFLLRRRNNKQ